MTFCRRRCCCCPFFLCRLVTSLIMHSVRLQIISQRFSYIAYQMIWNRLNAAAHWNGIYHFLFYVVKPHTNTRTHKHILLTPYYSKLNAMNLSNSVELSLCIQFILYYSTDLTFQIPSPHASPRVCSHKIKYKLLFCALLNVSWVRNGDEKGNIRKKAMNVEWLQWLK